MDMLIKTTAGILLAVILGLTISKREKDLTLLLSIAVCCMAVGAAFTYLEPVFHFFDKLQSVGELNTELFEILLKAVGIALLSEVVAMVCADAGNATLGKVLQLLSTAAILWLAIPLLEQLLELIETILGNV